jgi:hypothetical protein
LLEISLVFNKLKMGGKLIPHPTLPIPPVRRNPYTTTMYRAFGVLCG